MICRTATPLLFVLAMVVASVARAADAPPPAGVEFFETHIRPVLVETCYQCHSAASEKLKGGLYVDSKSGLLKGGKTGPAVVPGDPEKSLLIKAIRGTDEDLVMPPKKSLSKAQVAAFEQWVKMGAPDPRGDAPKVAAQGDLTVLSLADSKEFWSFKKPVLPKVPAVKDAWAKSPVDAFVLEKLNAAGLPHAAVADKRTLIRRATFDLIGLPPTAEEVAAFEADQSADAFEKVLDRLLASPQYGVRWARHWLDIARYADTKGYVFQEERRYPFAYTYRDWVVGAFNEDIPYDQFLTYQIAADRVLAERKIRDSRHLAAMGFLTLGRRFLNQLPDIIDDRIDVVTRGTMGLTVACARCHDHKFDPIPTADYYSLYGVFASSTEPADLPPIASPAGEKSAQTIEYEKELATRNAALDKYKQDAWDRIVGSARTPAGVEAYLTAAHKSRQASDGEMNKLADDNKVNPRLLRRWKTWLDQNAGLPLLAPWRELAKQPEAKAAETIKRLAAAISAEIANPKSQIASVPAFPTAFPVAEVSTLFNRDDRNKYEEIKRKRDALMATHPGAPPRAMAMVDLPNPVTPVIFKRGNAAMPGAQVPRQFLVSVAGENRKPFTDGSGRLELARAIASRDNPLTARVFVNRVWAQHFGKGIVRTPSDFGVRGERPTHPELLDYLAVSFMDDGWSVKKLHKRIMLSATYQQASSAGDKARQADAENRLLSHQNRQRLDFEATRDSLLFAAGQLDGAVGGKAVDLFAQPFSHRRTIYGVVDRQNLPGTMRAFDFASPDQHAPMRFANTVPQQALFMMNSPFVVEQARALATKVASVASPEEKIRTLYRAAFSRNPTSDELKLGLAYIESETAPQVVAQAPPAWQYGYGEYDVQSQRLKSFAPLPFFSGTAWQGGPKVPDRALNFALLTPDGGHAGIDQKHAVVRRWTAPRDGAVSISGTLSHGSANGDGVRGRIVSAATGELASLTVQNKSAQTQLDGVEVRAGQTIDFVVDCQKENSFDSFTWAVTLKMRLIPADAAGGEDTLEWNSRADFGGPVAKPAASLSPWEKYAQVLLETNEFVFVD